jgi:wobble nucleotide-excising tRNase
VISKITKLYGVGTLHAPLPSGALTLKAKTIIYGENGRGKTTLVAILRSMACGDTLGLRQRKTIKGVHAQSAQFLVGTQPHDLIGDKWSKIHPEICVFDATFISENVYSGTSVDPAQRKNLLSFAIGNQGVSLARRVDELAAKIAEKRTEESTAKEQIRKYIKGNLTPEQFAYLPPAAVGAEAELETARKKRDAIARASTILNLQTTSPIPFERFNFQRFSELLAETIEVVSIDAAERLSAHIASSHVTERWLEEGSRFETGAACPYCGQNTQGIPLVEAYRISFSEAYKTFKANLTSELDLLAETISSEKWMSVEATLNSNWTKLASWKEFLGEIELSFDLETHTSKVQLARAAVRAAIGRKLSSPLEAATLTKEELAVLDPLETTVTSVYDYNASRASLNERIAQLRNSVSGGNLSDAEARVQEIENRIARGTTAAARESNALLKAVADRQAFENEKNTARSTLDEHMKTVIGQYTVSINNHLKGCGTAFRIKELKTVYTGAKPRFDYVIELFGAPVDLANRPGSDVVFDSALSFGDKGALAFAFFLAKLENDPKRAQQTVVFDDPLSSLDSCRRRYTRQEIASLAPKVAQLIVLTHEEATVADIAGRLKESECAIFALKPHGDFSVFTTTTVKEITASDYARCFGALTHYLYGSGSPEDVVKNVRPFLEMNLRYRFSEEFGPDQSLGKMIGQIKSCDASRPLSGMYPLIATLEEINGYTTKHSHGDTALINTEKMLESDLKAIVTKAINLARGLPIRP